MINKNQFNRASKYTLDNIYIGASGSIPYTFPPLFTYKKFQYDQNNSSTGQQKWSSKEWDNSMEMSRRYEILPQDNTK